ncbi:hypothetical protein O6H91_03G067700 [Diphasiastrum complanatum]|uniref:Uncharacterized protein n=1 Tax=Diphasiastrum complanatum TaxID=34168 RepID=A0ACC2E7C1_DIPCM|nr:hypothetical protein O6H91_03G067700 [Diphasiastrum complanatum]
MACVGRAAWRSTQQLLWRSLSSTSTASGVAVESAAAAGKRARKKKKNLVDVIKFLSDWGVGAKVAKTHWTPKTFYKITNVKLYEDAAHGAAWGIYHESGKIEKIGGVNKRCWKYIDDVAIKTWKSL